MDEPRAIELCIVHRDPIGFEYLVRKYQREAYMHAFALVGNSAIVIGFLVLLGLLIIERISTYKVDPYKEIER